ncbi:MAG: porin [Gammaproteobacteria bacterium]
MNRNTSTKLITVVGSATLAMAIGVPAKAVVVVHGVNGWEASFEGSASGFYVHQDAGATLGGVAAETLATTGRSRASGEARVGSGPLPAFFSFSGGLPEVEVTRFAGKGQGRFAPASGDWDKKNYLSYSDVSQTVSQADLGDTYFGIGGDFGAVSIRRTLRPLQHQNYLTDLSVLGARADLDRRIALGHSGYEHLDPDYDARISYRTPDIGGFQVEAFMRGLYHESGSQPACGLGNCATDLTAWGGGLQLGLDTGHGSGEVSGSGYTGGALGSTLMVDEDALDPEAVKREHRGWLAQAAWTFPTRTKLGFSYGKSEADETGTRDASRLDIEGYSLREQRAWTVGVYHDVTDWFKLVAEYSKLEQERFDGKEQESDVVGVGWFLSW